MKETMGNRKVHCKYTEKFKKQALARAEKEGIPATAKALSLESANSTHGKIRKRMI